MAFVKDIFDGHNYMTEEAVATKPNLQVAIVEQPSEMQSEDLRVQAVNSIFGMLTHEEAEEIRNNRVNFKERF